MDKSFFFDLWKNAFKDLELQSDAKTVTQWITNNTELRGPICMYVEEARYRERSQRELEEEGLRDTQKEDDLIFRGISERMASRPPRFNSKIEEAACGLNIKLLKQKIEDIDAGDVYKEAEIYRHVQPRFDCSAMIYVSREPRVGELLLHIARQVGCPDLGEEWSKEGPEGKLCSYLRHKKYVILLDDIWDVETWDALRLGLPSDPKSGTRIIITSRDTAVGRYIGGESSIHEMHPLGSDQSWKLFCNQVMMPEHSAETAYPKEQIVESCGGVPLSIVVIAGVLRERGTIITNQVLEDIRHEDQHYGQDRCTRFVSLSYDNLPIPLKDCFLYLGLFPNSQRGKKY
ncbi:PREDICTED: disease resistance protein RPP13-like [Ipomoea nil]|uniref:disease resistance protein RPP13-like n=1 Tax=Ipomoea nil TaxID=35883 RepID=UPI0009013510|nr:PREDICTED: disease resistance protein RPP13-like [Ipomoea nil]